MSFIHPEDRDADMPRELTLREALDTGSAERVLAVMSRLRRQQAGRVLREEQAPPVAITPAMLEGWASM